MDELICPHCEEEVTQLSRTGNKRYPCGNCSRVIKHDTVKPFIEEGVVDVVDKRDDVGKGNSGNSGNSSDSGNSNSDTSSQDNGGGSDGSENPMGEKGQIDNREIIRQEGKKGLKKIKKRKLKEWLDSTDGVGPKTLNRILMVFDEEDMYSDSPETLFNLLDDELSATSTYINTIVNSVFSPEHDHQDLLRDQGYTPYFSASNSSPNNGGRQMNRGNGNQYNSNGQNQNQQNQQAQQQSQQQSQGMTKQEAVEMIKASQESDDGGSRRRGPATDALDAATEEAIQNMAQNMGGLMGTAQRLLESTLMSYFEDNPEKLVENMDLLQTFMEDGNNQQTGNQSQESESKENQKIDDALDGLREEQGLDSNNGPQTQQQDPVESNPSFRQPEKGASDETVDRQEDEGAVDSFEPNDEILNGGGPTPDDDIGSVEENNTEDNSNNEPQEAESDDEEDWFDKEFDSVEA